MKKYFNRDTEFLFTERTRGFHPKNHDNLIYNEDDTSARSILLINHLVHAIIQSNAVLFYIREDGMDMKNITSEKSSNKEDCIANAILHFCKYPCIIDDIYISFPNHVFNPYVELFIKTFNAKLLLSEYRDKDINTLKDFGYSCHTLDFELYQYLFLSPINRNKMTNEKLKSIVDRMNDFVASIRSEANSLPFKTLINNYQRLSTKNYKSLQDFINALFERHARLLVIRLDLGYGRGERTWDKIELAALNEKYQQAKQDREHFFNNMRSNKLFDNLLGYVWKLEYGNLKGFHYHMIFFFDGSKVREDISIAKMIGEYWFKTITDKKGLYFNCNANKQEYIKYGMYNCNAEKRECGNLGIGMINHSDTDLRNNLIEIVAQYLIKVDYYAKMLVIDEDGKKGRTFGKTQVKAKTSNSGRPRTSTPGYPELSFNLYPQLS